jgi:hypothetical protein
MAKFSVDGIDYQVSINVTPYKDTGYSNEQWEFQRMKVTLKNLKTKTTQVLQDDGKYKRGAIGYILRHIYVYQGKIAVFIESGLQGWEASWSPEFMAVTGKVK